jgi:hypothetical protein
MTAEVTPEVAQAAVAIAAAVRAQFGWPVEATKVNFDILTGAMTFSNRESWEVVTLYTSDLPD